MIYFVGFCSIYSTAKKKGMKKNEDLKLIFFIIGVLFLISRITLGHSCDQYDGEYAETHKVENITLSETGQTVEKKHNFSKSK